MANVALAQLPAMAFAFMLVLARTGSAVMLLPGVGETEIPATVRAGVAIALALLLEPVAPVHDVAMPAAPVGLLVLLAAEILTGLWLGWLARLALQVLPVAGQMIASVCGLSNVLQPDTIIGGQTAAVSHAFGLAAPVLVFATGLYAIPLHALAGSYDIVAVGGVLPSGETAAHALAGLAAAFALALQLAGPFLLAATAWQFALGLLSRLVPQLHIYFAAMPGQIAGGLLLLSMLSGGILGVWQDYLRQSFLHLPGV
jgi:flagellar biosynthetic protein FliR